jgi:hypothetical protein
VWTQGQDVDNPYWFPCQDSPRLKLTSELEITFPENWQALSNGHKTKDDILERKRTQRWNMPHPHAPYLVAFVGGDFERHANREGTVPLYLLLHKNHHRLGAQILQTTKTMVEFYERTFHTPFPWPQYGQSFVPHFIYGGMENTGCTINTDEVLGSDDFNDNGRSYELLVVHELAHQWFGDYVTCHHWSEGWLNEGFATYGEILWEEEHYGATEAIFYVLDHVMKSYQEEAKGYERPVVCRTYEFVSEIFDAHLYEKGGTVLRYISQRMGAENFRKGVGHYLKSHAYSTATTGDFARRLQEATGFNIEPILDSFIYSATSLTLSIDLVNTNSKILEVHIQQTQAISATGAQAAADKEKVLAFKAPLRVVFSDHTVSDFWVDVERESEKLAFPYDKPILYAMFDPYACLPASVEQKWPEHFCLNVLKANILGYPAFVAVQNLSTKFPTKHHAPLVASWLAQETSVRAKMSAYMLLGEKQGPLIQELHTHLVEETSSSMARQAYFKYFLPNKISILDDEKQREFAEKFITVAKNTKEFFRVREAALQGLFYVVTHSTALRVPKQKEHLLNFAWHFVETAKSELGILEAYALKLVAELGSAEQLSRLLDLWQHNARNPWRLNVACLDALATLAARYPEIRPDVRPALVARAGEFFPVRLASRLPEIWEKTQDPSYGADLERYINRKNYGLFSVLIPKARRVQKRFFETQVGQGGGQGPLNKDQWAEFQEMKKKIESLEQVIQALPKS